MGACADESWRSFGRHGAVPRAKCPVGSRGGRWPILSRQYARVPCDGRRTPRGRAPREGPQTSPRMSLTARAGFSRLQGRVTARDAEAEGASVPSVPGLLSCEHKSLSGHWTCSLSWGGGASLAKGRATACRAALGCAQPSPPPGSTPNADWERARRCGPPEAPIQCNAGPRGGAPSASDRVERDVVPQPQAPLVLMPCSLRRAPVLCLSWARLQEARGSPHPAKRGRFILRRGV
jgi:hypothetical protein